MKRIAIPILLLAGCSTAPVADLLDHFKPGQIVTDDKTAPYGGVCLPKQLGPPAGSPGVLPAPVFPGSPGAAPSATLTAPSAVASPVPDSPPPQWPIASPPPGPGPAR